MAFWASRLVNKVAFAICMLFMGWCILFASSTMPQECNPKIHYNLRNGTSPKILKCVLVRHCPPGKEPKIPCGSDIDIHDIIGFCKPCDNGTFSSTSGPGPCEICRGANCSKDQLPEGTCSAMQDNSFCRCKDGSAMNKDGTACEYRSQNNPTKYLSTTKKTVPTKMEKPSTQQPTTQQPSTQQPTTQQPTTNRPTTHQPKIHSKPTTHPKPTRYLKPTMGKQSTGKGIMNIRPSTKNFTAYSTTNSAVSNDQKVEKDKLSLGLIIVIAFLVLLFIILVALVIYFCWCKGKVRAGEHEKKSGCYALKQLDKNDAASQEKMLKYGKEEEAGSDLLEGYKRPFPESKRGFDKSCQDYSAPSFTAPSSGSMDIVNPEKKNGSVNIEIPNHVPINIKVIDRQMMASTN